MQTTLDLTQTLSEKEKMIYSLLCMNLSNKEIAYRVELSVSGVVFNLKSIYRKLGVSSCGKDDLHLCRQRAISYAGTRIEEIYPTDNVSGYAYTKKQLYAAASKLTWYGKERVTQMLDDLLMVLSKDSKAFATGVSKKEFNGAATKDSQGRYTTMIDTLNR